MNNKSDRSRRVNNDYRYESNDTASQVIRPDNDIQKQLEEEKRKREESDRKIKELEEKQKKPQPVSIKIRKKYKDTESSLAGIPSPVSSLVL